MGSVRYAFPSEPAVHSAMRFDPTAEAIRLSVTELIARQSARCALPQRVWYLWKPGFIARGLARLPVRLAS